MRKKNNSILVHTCCASCASFVFSELLKNGLEITAYFYNPSIDDPTEYQKRLRDLESYCDNNAINLIQTPFNSDEFEENIAPFKDINSIKYITDKDRYRRKRCHLCFSLLIQATVEKAKKEGFNYFTSTLLCSPYKDHDLVVDLSNEKALDYGLNFYYQDFRKGYWNGRNYGKNHHFYIPSSCGCKESLIEKRLE